jgi:circadian clock protein KaiC
MADEACRNGQTVHYLTFEESPEEVMRNTTSIGLELERWVNAGDLRIDALRAVEHGLEEHLLRIMDQVQRENPDVLIIDPISALTDMGEHFSAKAMMVRLCSFLKDHGTTTVLSELLPDQETDHSNMNISSTIDTWIRLRFVERNDRFERRIHIRKSRGQAIDNRVNLFRITSRGVSIEDG